MPNLSDLVGANNLKAVTLALTSAPGTNSQTFPTTNFFKVPLNAKYSDPYNICTLNTSLSTFTLPSGLYSVNLTLPSLKIVTRPVLISSKITVNGVTTSKWPYIKATEEGGEAASAELPYNSFQPAMVYLAGSSSVALEQYWSASTAFFGTTVNDNESNVYYRLDIWKLR
jgi:hypothetical protein